jgi:hypothetical protein
MTRKKIAEYRQKLRDILKNEEDESKRFEALKDLAKEVGAGYVRTEIAGTSTIPDGKGTLTTIHQNTISESELILNINNALQTEAMIDMCKDAARKFWVAIIATIIALISALAAWWAVVKMVG